jgi:hypothetical protein
MMTPPACPLGGPYVRPRTTSPCGSASVARPSAQIQAQRDNVLRLCSELIAIT